MLLTLLTALLQLAGLNIGHKFFKMKCAVTRYFSSSPLQRVSVLVPIRCCLFGFGFVFLVLFLRCNFF